MNDIASILSAHRGGMSAKKLSEVTGLSIKQLYAMAKANRIPAIKIGGRVIFDPARVAAWWRSKEAA